MIDSIFNHPWLVAHSAALRRLAIILACLILAVVVGRMAMNDKLLLLAGGVVGVVVLVVLALKPDWGVLALLAITLFFRVGFSTGTNSPITLSLALTGALAAAWIVRMLVEDKRIRALPLPINAPMLAFVVVVILSFFWSNAVHDPLVDNWDEFLKPRLGALGTMILSPAAAWLVANHLRTTRHLKVVVGMFIVAAAIGLAGIYGHFSLSILNTRGLFPLWAITLLAGQAMFNTSLSNRQRLALGLMAFAWFSYQFGQGQTWKSGWVPPLAAGFVLAGLRSRRLIGVLAVVAAIFVLINLDYISSSLEAEDEESGVTRQAAWEVNFSITRDHLLLGTGPAGYAAYYMTYLPTSATATHNNYIDVIAQTGVIGLAMFGWMLVAAGRMAAGMMRRVPRNGFEYGLAASLLSGFVGLVVAMALGDWFLPFAYTQGIAGYDYTVWGWMMIGLIMNLYHRLHHAPDHQPLAPLPAATDTLRGAATRS
jgi:O-antigen ligase